MTLRSWGRDPAAADDPIAANLRSDQGIESGLAYPLTGMIRNLTPLKDTSIAEPRARSSWLSFLALSLLFGSLSGLCSAASAQEESEADTLIEEGYRLLAEGDAEGALRLYQRAHAVSPSPRSLAQMGLAEGALGRWGDADEHLSLALESEDDPWIRRRATSLRRRLERVREQRAFEQREELLRPLSWALMSGGGGLALIGGILLGAGFAEHASLLSDCSNDTDGDPMLCHWMFSDDLRDRASRAETLVYSGDTLFYGGLLIGAAGAALLLYLEMMSAEEEEEPMVSLELGPGRLGGAIMGRW